MRITIRTCWAVLTLALLAPVGQATAQTLDEIARKAAERRKTAEAKPDPPKVYTNDDLKPASPPASAAPATPAPAPAATGPADKPAAAQKAPEEEKGEKYWRTLMAQAREDLRRNELFREALQTRVNSLSNDFARARRSRTARPDCLGSSDRRRRAGAREHRDRADQKENHRCRGGGTPGGCPARVAALIQPAHLSAPTGARNVNLPGVV